MVPTLLSNEHGRVLSGSLNWKLYLWLPRGMMGTPPSTSFLSVDNSLHKHIMIFYIHKIFYCVVNLTEADFNGCFQKVFFGMYICMYRYNILGLFFKIRCILFVYCIFVIGWWYLRNLQKLSNCEF